MACTDSMLSTTRLLGSTGLAISLGIAALAASTRVGAQSSALEVTSDTPEYCLRLLDRLSDRVRTAPAPAPHEVTDLSSEGQRMCDQGQIRGGIMRLRRAWLLMTPPPVAAGHPEDEARPH